MGQARTIIAGGVVVTPDEVKKTDILIDGGRIAEIGSDLAQRSPDVRIVDAGGCWVLPGGIDPHTHLDSRWEDTVTADDWLSGTIAAAAGGTTTVIDFCRPDRDEPMLDAVGTWKNRAAGKAVVDYGFHLVVRSASEAVLRDMKAAAAEGVTSFKLFMAYRDSLQLRDDELYLALEGIREAGGVALAHCENGDVIELLIARALASGENAPRHHALTRPPELEGEAASRIIRLAELTGTPLYIAHVSCRQSLDEIRRAQAAGQPVYGETCPQYLFIDSGYLDRELDEAVKYVWSPPPREKEHQPALWSGIRGGALQSIGSDHSSYRMEQKLADPADFTGIPNGGPGIEDRMSLLYHYGVVERGMDIRDFVRLTSTFAAKLFGLYPRKGTIAKGSDADLVVWDPRLKRTLSAKTHHMNVDYSVYEGHKVQGGPVLTMVRGQPVVERGRFVGTPGQGLFIHRKPYDNDF
ncbi:dihydropyrimidinase [Paenibacillus humicola]|uniref:dihydropyrimidinase n=1 Tax=Paenibacillus humicola TaxID=3110540 RepID=UPI00237C178A|nr:dihydropyrimidinase [Paenibacillus humicola]